MVSEMIVVSTKAEEMDRKPKSILKRSATTDMSVTQKIGTENQIQKSASVDSGDVVLATKTTTSSSGPVKRRSIRRRSSKPIKPELNSGQDTEAYEKIRERVFQERAVTNAIEALQERWGMIMMMYNDCVAMNKEKKERKLRKLDVKRQFELNVVAAIFLLMCCPVTVIFVLICR